MVLSQLIRESIADYFAIQLDCEIRLGKANQVDWLGACVQYGSLRVELERRREDPVNNVVKAWRQAKDSCEEAPFIMLHIFSGFYTSGRRSKVENAKFIGEMMNEWARENGRKIRYHALTFGFEPPAGDADPIITDKIACQTRLEIHSQLDSIFEVRSEHNAQVC